MDLIVYTKRLILKVEHADKAEAILDFYRHNSALFDNFEPTRPHNFYTEAYHRAVANAEYNSTIAGNFLRYYMYTKENPDKIMGSVNFSNITYGPFMKATLGYKLDIDYHHKGYATEAVAHCMDLMFHQYGMQRIEAKVVPHNQPSIDLLNRLHFRYEGIEYNAVSVRGNRVDLNRYSLCPCI